MESPNDFSLEDVTGTFFPMRDLFDQGGDLYEDTHLQCIDTDEEEDASYLSFLSDLNLLDVAGITSMFLFW